MQVKQSLIYQIELLLYRRPIYARIHFMDGQYHSVEFDPSATTREVTIICKCNSTVSYLLQRVDLYCDINIL